jgi:3-deoxy-D-arabino-heptulosonate 7-phosphate (DAHP) synthase
LAVGGIMILPVEVAPGRQELKRVTRTEAGPEVETLLPVSFVPLVAGAAKEERDESQQRRQVGGVAIGNDLPLVLIAGPCQLESRDHAFMVAGTLKDMAARLGIGLVYKTSFDKANRTSLAGRRGSGSIGRSASSPT